MQLQNKIKHILENNLVDQWRDTRLWGLVVFGIVVVLASWSGVRVIETNYDLQKKIAGLTQQNQIIELQNQNQKLQNQYYETDTFLELAARKQFGKAAPGEIVVLVPKDIALKYAAEVPQDAELVDKNKSESAEGGSRAIRNLRAWRDFIFGHTLHG